MARLKDVADLARVSTATASRVLSGKGFVSEELRRRVASAVQELNYTPDGIARSMSQRRTHTLGLVVSDITNPFFTDVARGVEDLAEARGFSVMLCNTDEEPDKERTYLSVLRQKRVDGMLLALASDDASSVRSLVAAGMKVVLIDRVVPNLDVPWVTVDNLGGMKQAVDYLIALGHRRIALVTGRMQVSAAVERLQGFKAALDAAGLPVHEELVVNGHFTENGGRAAGAQLTSLAAPPTAIVSSNNVMTTGLLLALQERAIRAPHDISLLSFDDLPYFRLLEQPLTAVAQPMYDLGKRACELLLQTIQDGAHDTVGPTRIQLPTRLIIRSSCRTVG